MTKREQLIQIVKEVVVNTNLTDSTVAYLANNVISCDQCPVTDCAPSCRLAIIRYLNEHGDEEAEE